MGTLSASRAIVSVACLGAVLAASVATWADPSPEAEPRFTIHRTVAPAVSEEIEPPPVGSYEQRYPYPIPRAFADRTDERGGRQIHFVYMVPNDRPDEHLDELGVLENSVRSVNAWMAQRTGLRWRLDTFTFTWDDPATPEEDPAPIQAVDVTFVFVDRPGSELATLDAVQQELTARGLDRTEKRYFTYVASDGGPACGVSRTPLYPGQEPVGWDPYVEGKYAQIHLFSNPACRSREFATGPAAPSWAEAIVLHEIVHNDGHLVAYAPHSCSPANGHPCRPFNNVTIGDDELLPSDPERVDVMYPTATVPLSEKVLDVGNDDYFRHPFTWRDLEDSPYLEPAGGGNS